MIAGAVGGIAVPLVVGGLGNWSAALVLFLIVVVGLGSLRFLRGRR